MKKTVRVKIGGQEYNLRSDDEAKVRDVAAKVDTQFRLIQGSSKEQSTATLSILTALNVAEQEHDVRQQQQRDKLYLASEVEKMVAYLRQSFGDASIGSKTFADTPLPVGNTTHGSKNQDVLEYEKTNDKGYTKAPMQKNHNEKQEKSSLAGTVSLPTNLGKSDTIS
ncbi:MAG: cell division protein ZapA [Candidatus Kapaibacterium sp.]|nr:MAG: cell division protein ZapA [Candidatus Kapabacteria bacterium]